MILLIHSMTLTKRVANVQRMEKLVENQMIACFALKGTLQ